MAALFAVHPLRVESVAWVSERKDVLSGCFWMTTLLAYAWYARRRGAGRYVLVGRLARARPAGQADAGHAAVRAAAARLVAAAAPHRRDQTRLSRVCGAGLEKLPLFAIVAACTAATRRRAGSRGAVATLETVPFGLRAAQRARRVRRLPAAGRSGRCDLAVFYPHAGLSPRRCRRRRCSGRRWPAPCCSRCCRRSRCRPGAPATVRGDRVVLVRRHVGAGDRPGARRPAGDGGSLRLPAVDRHLRRRRLGGARRRAHAGRRRAVLGWRRCRRARAVRRGDAAPDRRLARQRDACSSTRSR